ncbi:hypothetical protein M3Y95_00663500 [Aphelenchoides besseyi]|nr:hypothetical protein M3Y95_00663500 [Aphelenchoides besseyi]
MRLLLLVLTKILIVIFLFGLFECCSAKKVGIGREIIDQEGNSTTYSLFYRVVEGFHTEVNISRVMNVSWDSDAKNQLHLQVGVICEIFLDIIDPTYPPLFSVLNPLDPDVHFLRGPWFYVDIAEHVGKVILFNGSTTVELNDTCYPLMTHHPNGGVIVNLTLRQIPERRFQLKLQFPTSVRLYMKRENPDESVEDNDRWITNHEKWATAHNTILGSGAIFAVGFSLVVFIILSWKCGMFEWCKKQKNRVTDKNFNDLKSLNSTNINKNDFSISTASTRPTK